MLFRKLGTYVPSVSKIISAYAEIILEKSKSLVGAYCFVVIEIYSHICQFS